ncbi:MetQ/NlpA family ABC transporter substrate-binding protein [Weissella viridescens]|uniref:MetQ/NlpA family ABC transporter substrate-binding protein n=1 Tax=Weissella viridescens TaxID=1629 RepID=UPI002577210F|nr:MetQ/NlpA family ABC transporter substrate-binding protein [Weissella viridescens]WJI91363.1 MetQ/NlpA family ABC transporter substrate-binding protein [Weissella viridescens]
MSKFIKFGTIAATTLIAASTAAPLVSGTPVHADSKPTTVTVGLVGSDEADIWKEVAKTAKDKYNIKIKTKTFTDYNQPNKAVAGAFKSKSVQGAVINTNYAQQAKINLKSAIYVEPVNKDSKQWVNVIAAKKSKADKSTYEDVVKAYQTKATEKAIKKEHGDSEIPAWNKKF